MSPMQRAQTLTRPASQDEQDVAENWRTRAKCRDEDPELFFLKETKDQAQAICRQCPVRKMCLRDAVETKETGGIRGGRTGKEIKALIRAQAQAAAPLRSPEQHRVLATAATNNAIAGQKLRAQIAELACAGMSNGDIAIKVERSRVTVQHHLRTLRLQGTIPNEAGWTPPAPPAACGTPAGWARHKRYEEGWIDCQPCRDAHNERQAQRRRENRARAKGANS